MMTSSSSALLGIFVPSLEMLTIFAVAASLPVIFVLWMKGWLGSVKDVHPDDAEREQAKADQEHRAQQGHGHAHAHAHGHGHHPVAAHAAPAGASTAAGSQGPRPVHG